MDDLRGARVLVTGGSGFIGARLTRRLVEEGAEVHVLSSAVSAVYPVRLVDLRDRITVHGGNLADRSAMDAVVAAARPRLVFHLGAYTHVLKSWSRVDECVQTNIQGTLNLLQALNGDYERFVFTSTSEVYGPIGVPFREDATVDPASPYSVSKYAGERYCRMFAAGKGWPIVIVRPFNAYGPGQTPDRVIPEIIVRSLRGERLRMTEGRQTREFNFADDLATGFLAAATTPGIEGDVFNLGSGQEVSMREIAETILDILGRPVEPEFGALPDRPNEIWRMVSDSTKAREHLGWDGGRPLRDGLAATIDWYRKELQRPDSSFVT